MKYKDENGNWINIHVKAIDNEPLSSTKIYFGTTEPNGYKFANGQELSRTEYAELFKIIGTTYGTGDGSTTFNLPNMNGRVPVGLNVNQEWFNTLGKTGGSTEVTLTVEQMPTHKHTLGSIGTGSGPYNYNVSSLPIGTGNSFDTSEVGEDKAHSNLQPYITVNYIIKVKNLATLPPNAELIDVTGTPSDTNTYNANAIYELLEGYVLYDNSEGTYEKITLSETSANFERIEIYGFSASSNNRLCCSTKINNPNGKKTVLETTFHANTNTTIWVSANISINGNTISISQNITRTSGGDAAENEMFIEKVIAYKRKN